MDDAKLRAIAKAGRDLSIADDRAVSWDEAQRYVERTFIGAQYALHERWVDLGRAVRDALPGPLRRLFS